MCFAPRPSERSKTLQPGPQFVDKPLERKWTLQLGLGRGGRRARRNSGGSGGAPGRGVPQGRVEAHLGPTGGWGWGNGVAGAGVRRRPAAVAAAARSPARRRLGVDNARPWGVH
jgi:hypothetical protein